MDAADDKASSEASLRMVVDAFGFLIRKSPSE